MSPASPTNIDAAEVAKFDTDAERWWDADGPFRPLHDLNPVRFRYVNSRAPLSGRRVVDVGCGGGILSEAIAITGARVTGIDASAPTLDVARRHAEAARIRIDYQCKDAETLAGEEPQGFDVLTCMELLEHVPSPPQLIAACAALVGAGGDVFFSTINRTPAAYALAVLAAEYVFNLLPKGTHEYRRFIRPSELAGWGRAAGLEIVDVSGMTYNPLTRQARLTRSAAVNYLVHFRRPA